MDDRRTATIGATVEPLPRATIGEIQICNWTEAASSPKFGAANDTSANSAALRKRERMDELSETQITMKNVLHLAKNARSAPIIPSHRVTDFVRCHAPIRRFATAVRTGPHRNDVCPARRALVPFTPAMRRAARSGGIRRRRSSGNGRGCVARVASESCPLAGADRHRTR